MSVPWCSVMLNWLCCAQLDERTPRTGPEGSEGARRHRRQGTADAAQSPQALRARSTGTLVYRFSALSSTHN